MFYECANPDCLAPFDYSQGWLYRFHKEKRPGEAPSNTHSVQHFWLCAKCAKEFTLHYVHDRGVLMQRRLANLNKSDEHRLVAAA